MSDDATTRKVRRTIAEGFVRAHGDRAHLTDDGPDPHCGCGHRQGDHHDGSDGHWHCTYCPCPAFWPAAEGACPDCGEQWDESTGKCSVCPLTIEQIAERNAR